MAFSCSPAGRRSTGMTSRPLDPSRRPPGGAALQLRAAAGGDVRRAERLAHGGEPDRRGGDGLLLLRRRGRLRGARPAAGHGQPVPRSGGGTHAFMVSLIVAEIGGWLVLIRRLRRWPDPLTGRPPKRSLRARCYACSTIVEVASRELRNDTAGVLRRVEAGETVVITVRGKPVADLAPHRSEDAPRWLSPADVIVEILAILPAIRPAGADLATADGTRRPRISGRSCERRAGRRGFA